MPHNHAISHIEPILSHHSSVGATQENSHVIGSYQLYSYSYDVESPVSGSNTVAVNVHAFATTLSPVCKLP